MVDGVVEKKQSEDGYSTIREIPQATEQNRLHSLEKCVSGQPLVSPLSWPREKSYQKLGTVHIEFGYNVLYSSRFLFTGGDVCRLGSRGGCIC
jgi:hypothetical protein